MLFYSTNDAPNKKSKRLRDEKVKGSRSVVAIDTASIDKFEMKKKRKKY